MKPSTLAFETRALAEHAGEIRKRAKQVSAIAAHLKAEGYCASAIILEDTADYIIRLAGEIDAEGHRVLPNIEGSTK